MWAHRDEVDTLREYDDNELRGNGADVHRESGVSVLNSLRWEDMWKLEYQTRYAMIGSRVCVWVCVDSCVRADFVESSK